jgi:hypothetical protein
MGCQEFIDDAPWRGVEDFDPTAMMAIDDAVLAHPQTPQTLKAFLQRPKITPPAG